MRVERPDAELSAALPLTTLRAGRSNTASLLARFRQGRQGLIIRGRRFRDSETGQVAGPRSGKVGRDSNSQAIKIWPGSSVGRAVD